MMSYSLSIFSVNEVGAFSEYSFSEFKLFVLNYMMFNWFIFEYIIRLTIVPGHSDDYIIVFISYVLHVNWSSMNQFHILVIRYQSHK